MQKMGTQNIGMRGMNYKALRQAPLIRWRPRGTQKTVLFPESAVASAGDSFCQVIAPPPKEVYGANNQRFNGRLRQGFYLQS